VNLLHASWFFVIAAALAGCCGGGEAYALHVKIALQDDGQGASLFTRNGSIVQWA
jgi:hypothetical protein